MKKFIKILLIMLVFLFVPIKSNATELDILDMQVELKDNGDAFFTNKFIYNDNEGTEHYFILDNSNDSEIKDFSVIRNGQPMNNIGDWDINKSFEEKSGKYGIVNNGNSYELCYGITEYGKNEFVLKYTITNFVKQLEDTQMVFWEFLSRTFEDNPSFVNIDIKKEGYYFESTNSKIWAFGYDGNIIFKNGNIVANTNGDLPSGDKITILVKFEDPIFTPTSIIDKDFMYYKELAFEDSSYDINLEEGTGGETENISDDRFYAVDSSYTDKKSRIVGIIAIISTLLIALGLKYQSKRVRSDEYKGTRIDAIKMKKSSYDKQYFQEIPYEGNLSDLYILIEKGWDKEFQNYMSAYLLKWIKENRIIARKEDIGMLFKKEETVFEIVDGHYSPEDHMEKTLFEYMNESTENSRIIQSKTFSKWVGRNYDRIENLIYKARDLSRDKLISLGYLTEEVEVNTFTKYRKIILTEEGKILVSKLVGFENYLKDYSLLNERDSYNVHIWDDFMIYAALYGITEEVQKEFKNIYPKYAEESYYDYYTLYYITGMTSRAYNSYHSATSSESSGFGGGASFGGGGGSFGGGGGGTR